MRKQWGSVSEPLALTRLCELTAVAPCTVYASHKATRPDVQELGLPTLVDAEYTRHPFYGSRKIRQYLHGLGRKINLKRVQAVCLEQSLQEYGTPEIFNTDQGCQFSSVALRARSRQTVLPSAWMGEAGHWIIFLWDGCEVASNMKMCT